MSTTHKGDWMDRCPVMVAARPDGQGGVIFRCTKHRGHGGEHETVMPAQDWPGVTSEATFTATLRWYGDEQ